MIIMVIKIGQNTKNLPMNLLAHKAAEAVTASVVAVTNTKAANAKILAQTT